MKQAHRALAATFAITASCACAQAGVYFQAWMHSQLSMSSAQVAAANGGWIGIEAVPTALSSSRTVAGGPGVQSVVTIAEANARRSPDRADATLFESNLDIEGMLMSTAAPARIGANVTATQTILFSDQRTDATEDTVVNFQLFTHWMAEVGSEGALDGGVRADVGWSAWASDPVSGTLAQERNTESGVSPRRVDGHAGLWWHLFSVTVPAAGTTVFEFTTYVDAWGESASVPAAGPVCIAVIACAIAGRRRRG